jgi:hypothetical protein
MGSGAPSNQFSHATMRSQARPFDKHEAFDEHAYRARSAISAIATI